MNSENLKNQIKILEDGCGNAWVTCSEFGDKCGLQIVRPGKTQCWCDSYVQWIDSFSSIEETRGFKGEGWYFWDELGCNCYGPFESKAEAKTKLSEYSKTLE